LHSLNFFLNTRRKKDKTNPEKLIIELRAMRRNYEEAFSPEEKKTIHNTVKFLRNQTIDYVLKDDFKKMKEEHAHNIESLEQNIESLIQKVDDLVTVAHKKESRKKMRDLIFMFNDKITLKILKKHKFDNWRRFADKNQKNGKCSEEMTNTRIKINQELNKYDNHINIEDLLYYTRQANKEFHCDTKTSDEQEIFLTECDNYKFDEQDEFAKAMVKVLKKKN